jgi:hypothetical protein
MIEIAAAQGCVVAVGQPEAGVRHSLPERRGLVTAENSPSSSR